MSTCKRMIADVDKAESLLNEVVYNKDTNTLEIGGNVYVDGKEEMHDLGNGIFVKELHNDMALIYVNNADTAIHYYGIGYLVAGYTFRGIAFEDGGDSAGSIEVDLTNGEVFIGLFAGDAATQRKLYEHQLTISTQAVSFYIDYYSTKNIVIDSLQDLTAVVRPNANTKIGLGSTYLKYENNVWKLASGELITSVADNVVPLS